MFQKNIESGKAGTVEYLELGGRGKILTYF